MQAPKEPVYIAEGIHWVGALNPSLRRFDVVMETEFGTSYNAYLVKGSEKTALIDSVKDGFLEESLALIRQLTAPEDIDYIILQHTEPDHSGSIAALLEYAKNARVLCTKPASLYLPHIANRDLPLDVLRDGDTIDLGGKVLQCIVAPFLHWPDTMFTYEAQTGTLFTCDAFGCHYAAPAILESKTDAAFKGARRYYYDCIVSPFAPHVAKAIAHVNALSLPAINRILPSHGPVLDADPQGAIELYAAWANERPPLTGNRVFIGYVTCYGYTRCMAQALYDLLQAAQVEVDMVDFTDITSAEAAARMYLADVVAIGSPTVNADALPPVWAALSEVSVPIVRGRKAAVFGSYGWSGEGVPFVEQRLMGLGYKVLGTVKARFRPDEGALDEMSALGDRILAALNKA